MMDFASACVSRHAIEHFELDFGLLSHGFFGL